LGRPDHQRIELLPVHETTSEQCGLLEDQTGNYQRCQHRQSTALIVIIKQATADEIISTAVCTSQLHIHIHVRAVFTIQCITHNVIYVIDHVRHPSVLFLQAHNTQNPAQGSGPRLSYKNGKEKTKEISSYL